ncbi:MAG: hypothetical protein PHT07_21465 [Paludibacter sp.]|nr:hypothetical protein [Paludibacter sp.]
MAKKRLKNVAEQTKKKPARPKKTTATSRGSLRPRKKLSWSKMHVRHVLYTHYKTRYPDWQSTREDAGIVIQQLKDAGYKRATKKGILQRIKLTRLEEIQKRKESERPTENVESFFAHHPNLLQPIPFFQIETELCFPWRGISKKIVLWTKYIWTTGAVYRGGATVPYNETFAEYTREMAKLQDKPRKAKEDYINDWYFKIITKNAKWDKEMQAYMVEVITCNGDGEKTFYFGEEEEPELPPQVEKEPSPPERPPEAPEKPPAAPGEISPEQRVEVEKERVRAEAEAKKEYKISQGREYAQLLKDKVITFEQFKELMSDLNKS